MFGELTSRQIAELVAKRKSWLQSQKMNAWSMTIAGYNRHVFDYTGAWQEFDKKEVIGMQMGIILGILQDRGCHKAAQAVRDNIQEHNASIENQLRDLERNGYSAHYWHEQGY